MADDVTLPGTGAVVAADELTIGGTPVKVQRVKTALGRDGVYIADLAGRDLGSGDGAMYVEPRIRSLPFTITPVISVSPAYTAKDAVGGLNTIAGAALVAGGSI